MLRCRTFFNVDAVHLLGHVDHLEEKIQLDLLSADHALQLRNAVLELLELEVGGIRHVDDPDARFGCPGVEGYPPVDRELADLVHVGDLGHGELALFEFLHPRTLERNGEDPLGKGCQELFC